VDPFVIGLIVVAIAIIGYFVVLRKKGPEQLEAPAEPRKLEGKERPGERAPKSQRPKADDKAAPAKTQKAEPAKPSKPPADRADEGEDEPDLDEERAARAKKRAGAAPSPVSRRKEDVAGLRKGLKKTREEGGLFGRLKALFTTRKEIDPSIVDQMEEVLLTSDVGVKTTETLLSEIREQLEKEELADSGRVWSALRRRAAEILSIGGGPISLSAKPTVVMFIGVNGVGKTTTIGKLATRLQADGKKVVLAAGDTFRAAAVQQLEVWGKRVGCEVVKGKDGANPGAVIFDAIKRAEEIDADVVLADTAGRLHTKTNLMDELTKVARTMTKAQDGAPHETLLVLDATNGQNAMAQAAQFKEALPISGIVLTKLDGTAKGGVILGICSEHQLPVRYIGIGERPEDLRDFMPDEFVEAMLGDGGESANEAA
jgi:fused signal recognition particle receptor